MKPGHSSAIPSARLSSFRLLVATAAWAVLVISGISVLVAYSATPVDTRGAPASWPEAAGLRPVAERGTLIVALHPHCPCSRATVAELAEIAAQTHGLIAIRVLAWQPDGFQDDWYDTETTRAAAAIPGVEMIRDQSGAMAAAFRVSASGETFFYDAGSRLRFHGGITAGRGQVGANAGRTAIESLVQSGAAAATTTPVYGCSLPAAK